MGVLPQTLPLCLSEEQLVFPSIEKEIVAVLTVLKRGTNLFCFIQIGSCHIMRCALGGRRRLRWQLKAFSLFFFVTHRNTMESSEFACTSWSARALLKGCVSE